MICSFGRAGYYNMVHNPITDKQARPVFDIRQTNIAKGVAVLLLLWHHLFYYAPKYYNRFTSLYMFHGKPIECQISVFCKVCVAIFLILSGYGLYKSRNSYCLRRAAYDNGRKKITGELVFVKNHLLRLMMNFWFIYLIFVPLGIGFGMPFWEVYEHNALYGIVDFLGLANLFGTPTMNVTWWFMSAIILLYIIFPLLVKTADWSSEILICCTVGLMLIPRFISVPYVGQYFILVPPFVLGILCAKHNALERIAVHCNSPVKHIAISGIAVILTAVLRYIFGGSFDAVFGLSVILFTYLLISKIQFVNKLFEHLGKHSGAIFMFHTFIFSLYFIDFIYWFKYPPVIFLVMTVICYAVAVGLELIKKLIRYDKLVKMVTR